MIRGRKRVSDRPYFNGPLQMKNKLVLKTCVVCGGEYEGTSAQKSCSDACKDKRWRAMIDKMLRERRSTAERCPTCGQVLRTKKILALEVNHAPVPR